MQQGQLYIVSAPSGAGKTSLLSQLRQQLKYVTVSVSHTTRPPRSGEIEGEHYQFVSVEAFKQAIQEELFLEYAQVFDNYYGTSKASIAALLNTGKDVILEIDWQGAQQVRQSYPNAVSIFIMPPSRDALRQRLENRGQDSAEIINQRLNGAISDMSHFVEFDYVVINDDFDIALEDLIAIVKASRLRQNIQVIRHADRIQGLLSN